MALLIGAVTTPWSVLSSARRVAVSTYWNDASPPAVVGRPGTRLSAGSCESGSTGSTLGSVGYSVPNCQAVSIRQEPRRRVVSLRVVKSPSTTRRQERGSTLAALSTTSGPIPAGSPIVTPIRGSIVRRLVGAHGQWKKTRPKLRPTKTAEGGGKSPFSFPVP